MKKTIIEKAETAIELLNEAAVIMHRQMKSGELNNEAAFLSIYAAQKHVRTFKKSYFARTSDPKHLPQLRQFHSSDVHGELETAHERFGRVLKHYAQAVGAVFHTAGE